MKITKNQLLKIIKEEIQGTLNEGLLDMIGLGGGKDKPSHLLKRAVKANKFDNFEEFRQLIDNEKLISRLISVTKDLKPTLGIRTALSLAILKRKQGNSEHIENFISRYEERSKP